VEADGSNMSRYKQQRKKEERNMFIK